MFNFFQPNTPEINATEVKKALDSHADVLVVDVRTREEYEEGHIQNSVLMPLQTLQTQVTSLTDKSKTLYVYCRSGARSARAVMILQQLGFSNVQNMAGGLLSWEANGFPLTR